MSMNEIRAQGLLAQRYNTHCLGLFPRISSPVLASKCGYTNNLSSHPVGNTMHGQLKLKIQNALKAAVGLDPEALGVFVGGRRRNRRRKKKNGQNKRKQKKAENPKNVHKNKASKGVVERKEEKNPLIKTDYNDNISCSIGSQLIYGMPQTVIGQDINNTNEETIDKVILSQPKTSWESKVEKENNDNSLKNAQLLNDVDIDKLLTDDLIIASKLTKTEILAAMQEIKEGFELISLDDDIDDEEESDYDEMDEVEGNSKTTLKDELDDAINANNISGRGEPDGIAEEEIPKMEVDIEEDCEDLETDDLPVQYQPEIQDEVIVKPETIPLIERACPISGQNPDMACCVIL